MAASLRKLLKSFVGGEEEQAPVSDSRSSSESHRNHDPASVEGARETPMAPKPGKLVAPSRQRTLGGHKSSRADPYDIPEGQPVLRPKSSKHADFSPLHKQKKTATKSPRGNQTAALSSSHNTEAQNPEEEQDPEPRRSSRKRARESTDPALPSSSKARRKSPGVTDPDVAINATAQDEKDGLFVSDRSAAEGIQSTDPTADPNEHVPPQSAPGKRGRIRKDLEGGESKTTAQSGSEAQPSNGNISGKRRSERVQNLNASASGKSPVRASHTALPAKPKLIPKKGLRVLEEDRAQEDAEAEPEKVAQRYARASQVLFAVDDDVQDENAEDSDDDARKIALQARRQRPQSFNVHKAKVGRSGRVIYDHLFVRWPELKLILQSARKIGVSHQGGVAQDKCDIPLSDRHVARLVQRFFRLKTKLKSMSSAIEKGEDSPDLFDEFAAIKEGIDVLCGCTQDTDHPIDLTSADTASEIYFHIFPKLVDLLCCMLESFQLTDAGDAVPALGISPVHGKMVANLIEWTLLLIHGASKYTNRPDASLSIVQRVREMAPKLRDMEKAIRGQIARYEEQRARRHRLARLAIQREAEEREEEQRRVENARWSDLQDLWTQLHTERKYYEAAIIPKAKLRYLALPEPELDIDFNGEEFERVQMFRPRVGPSPAAIQRVEDKGPWPEASVAALIRGLQKYADKGKKLIFRHIFAEYCGRGGPLNAYNVTEIVYWAAKLKESLMRDETAEVEDWVFEIPNWLKVESLWDEV